jgi:hypothetical protein
MPAGKQAKKFIFRILFLGDLFLGDLFLAFCF